MTFPANDLTVAKKPGVHTLPGTSKPNITATMLKHESYKKSTNSHM